MKIPLKFIVGIFIIYFYKSIKYITKILKVRNSKSKLAFLGSKFEN